MPNTIGASTTYLTATPNQIHAHTHTQHITQHITPIRTHGGNPAVYGWILDFLSFNFEPDIEQQRT
jgi:hypothetical protein